MVGGLEVITGPMGLVGLCKDVGFCPEKSLKS